MNDPIEQLREEFYNRFPVFAKKCCVANKDVADWWIERFQRAKEKGYEEGYHAGLDSKYGEKMHSRIIGAAKILFLGEIREEIRVGAPWVQQNDGKKMLEMFEKAHPTLKSLSLGDKETKEI